MNYNSQLQSNNTDLQQVLETLQHKAAGGNSPLETCTVQFEKEGLAPPAEFIVHYIDINFTYQVLNDYDSILVPKNTIIAIENWSAIAIASSGATQLFYNTGSTAYLITDNATLSFH